MTYDNYLALCDKIGDPALTIEGAYRATKYCDLVTYDIQDLLLRNEFFTEDDAKLLGFIEHSNEPIIGNEDQVAFVDPIFAHAFSVVVSPNTVDIYDIVNKFVETNYPVTVNFIRNDHYSNGAYRYKLDEEFSIPFQTNREITEDDYDVSIVNVDDDTITSFSTQGLYTMTITFKGNYTGSKSCKIVIS